MRRILPRFRRWVRAVDFWVQDHHVMVVIAMFVLLITGAGALLWTDWDAVIELAKDLAPVVTIVSIIASAFLGVIKWFRKRRAARLARRATATMPRARDARADRPVSAPVPSGIAGVEDADRED